MIRMDSIGCVIEDYPRIEDDDGYIPSYGVCDMPKQFNIQFADRLRKTGRIFIIEFELLSKADFPKWRWHKHGPYIGNGKPKCEHIGDEEGFEFVTLFHVKEICGVGE